MNRDFLVVQWIRICLLMQGTWVQSLIWEDLMCHRATKSMAPQLLNPACLVPELCSKRSHHSEKPVHNKEE